MLKMNGVNKSQEEEEEEDKSMKGGGLQLQPARVQKHRMMECPLRSRKKNEEEAEGKVPQQRPLQAKHRTEADRHVTHT